MSILAKAIRICRPLAAASALGLLGSSGGLAQATPASLAGGALALASTEMALPAKDGTGRVTYDFVADALREVGEADVALVDLEPLHGSLERGRVTATQLRQLLPWDPRLDSYELSGVELAELLASPAAQKASVVRSGVSPEAGNTRRFAINGRPLSSSSRYRVVLLNGAALSAPATPRPLTITLHQSLARYLRAHPFLRATPQGRVIAGELPASVQCRDQLQMVDRGRAATETAKH